MEEAQGRREVQGRRMGLLEIDMTLLGGLWVSLFSAFVGFDLNYFTGFSLNVWTEGWKGRVSHFITFFFCTGDFLFFFLFCSLLPFNLASDFMIATVNLSGAKL